MGLGIDEECEFGGWTRSGLSVGETPTSSSRRIGAKLALFLPAGSRRRRLEWSLMGVGSFGVSKWKVEKMGKDRRWKNRSQSLPTFHHSRHLTPTPKLPSPSLKRAPKESQSSMGAPSPILYHFPLYIPRFFIRRRASGYPRLRTRGGHIKTHTKNNYQRDAPRAHAHPPVAPSVVCKFYAIESIQRSATRYKLMLTVFGRRLSSMIT